MNLFEQPAIRVFQQPAEIVRESEPVVTHIRTKILSTLRPQRFNYFAAWDDSPFMHTHNFRPPIRVHTKGGHRWRMGIASRGLGLIGTALRQISKNPKNPNYFFLSLCPKLARSFVVQLNDATVNC
jgi:hypothetical protein